MRDILYIKDVVELYFKTIEKAEEVKGQAFNIGGGMENSISLIELFEVLEREMDIELKYEKLLRRISDQKIFVADILKVKEKMGWKPKISKLNGIKKMIEWIIKLY